MLDCGFAELSTRAYRLFFKAQYRLQMEGFVSSWVSACCTDTGLSAGMPLGLSLVKFQGGRECSKEHGFAISAGS